MRKNETLSGVRDCDLGCKYKEWGNMGYFGNLIVVFVFILCNILNSIVE